MEKGKEYYAFISYKREDEKWAKWLQDKLEHYRFPTKLNGWTDLPMQIRPTFRDVTDLKPGLLAEEINNALRSSEWLIVICSPLSAKSPWVCKEARTFIDLGRANHIIPFVIEGNPFSNDEATECYPEALLDLKGSKELLAANINDIGRDAAAIKIVARMFNLRFDALWQRHEREMKHRRNWLIVAISTFMFAVLSVAGWIGWQSRTIQRQNVQLQEQISAINVLSTGYVLQTSDNPFDSFKTTKILIKDKASDKVISTIDMVRDIITSAQFSPDGRRVIVTGLYKSFLYDVETGNEIRTVYSTQKTIVCATYSPDGKKFLTASYDGVINIWDTETGMLLQSFNGNVRGLAFAAFDASGLRVLAKSTDNEIIIWDLETGRVHPFETDNIQYLKPKYEVGNRIIVPCTSDNAKE